MRKERHEEVLKEVSDEIESALNDKEGLLGHQRRLAFSLSLGAVNLLELHFHNLNIMKEGSKIDHTWFKRKKENVFEKLEVQITSPITSIENIDAIVDVVREIEEKRDDLAYGAPASEEVLQEKINLFFKLKGMLKC
jgi:NAD-dependent DNA ligase